MLPPSETHPPRTRSAAVALNRAAYRFSRDWVTWFLALTGLWVVLPWLAPVFMRLGWEAPAQAIYWLYSFQCHQLPQRSFFFVWARADDSTGSHSRALA